MSQRAVFGSKLPTIVLFGISKHHLHTYLAFAAIINHRYTNLIK